MFRNRIISGMLAVAFLTLSLTGCGGRDEPASTVSREPTKPLEVVVFSTQVADTATPVVIPTFTLTPSVLDTPTPVSEADVAATQAAQATPTPAVVRAENENPLTGLIVDDPAILQRRPLHVRIGNDPQARPQVNLSEADLVYEEIVEWWITRLTAIYYGTAPEVVGPVRSARLINGQLTQQYNAGLINSGGSDGVRWELSQQPIVNLDEYFHPKPYFYREGEPWQRRLAVNIASAHDYMASQSLQSATTLRGFAFDEMPPAGTPAETIFIDYPSKDSKVTWRYNGDTGEYERSIAGEPMIDAATNQVLSVPNVIIYFAQHAETEIVEDSTGATSVRIEANGEGPAFIFRDGVRLEGRWRTDGTQTPEFIDPNDQPIPLHPGRSWIQVVPRDYEIEVNGG